ncbi:MULTISPECIES: DUF4124 domain-containing protein [unclassified Wenzhouxiangella]|uniref:DUF4124 domain-containing protein n=1 Tax=unclassified Wenzhouxiangella TaxID=2613841 RepID=UPI000E326D84|nr:MULTISPECIES: DUF4124 domain-containing protein [unclassified Wenzhouxiangella]RFF28630.1 DUF4124 domain-containing protein [Wenzhouxiangella sp. 15181]RFP68945.1 DUF4124 domain-containing protein [Wenzhouxiangella sp. 15190]
MKHRIMIPAAFVLFALPAAAQIYRCESDGVVAFSDRPCGSNQTLHADGQGVSFVTPDENLSALAEATQAFLRERRERLARRERKRRPSAPPSARTANDQVEKVYVPWPIPQDIDDRLSDQRNRRNEQDARPGNPGNDRYSPLNGPILGTRPNSAAFEARNRDPDRRR